MSRYEMLIVSELPTEAVDRVAWFAPSLPLKIQMQWVKSGGRLASITLLHLNADEHVDYFFVDAARPCPLASRCAASGLPLDT